jgi:hypothetical protein
MAVVLLVGTIWAGWTAVDWALTYRWPVVACEIQASAVVDGTSKDRRVVQVAYRYVWQGRAYTGRTIQKDGNGSYELDEAERLARAYPVGARRTCYVNPRRPTDAILKRDNVWLPIVLALIAAPVAVLLVIRPDRSLELASGPFLTVMGVAGFVLFFALPVWKSFQARRWKPTPCVVQSSVVRSEFRSASLIVYKLYWPEIVYQYHKNGVRYRGDTDNLTDRGSLWYYGPRAVVRRTPAGMRTTCYVNPADPSEAVLSRRLSPALWLGVWPLIMAVLGVGQTVQTWSDRSIWVGPPEFWGMLVLGAVTAAALEITRITGTVLVRDWRVGDETGPEQAVVLVSALVAAVLLSFWIGLAIRHGRGPGREPVVARSSEQLWDLELDGWL